MVRPSRRKKILPSASTPLFTAVGLAWISNISAVGQECCIESDRRIEFLDSTESTGLGSSLDVDSNRLVVGAVYYPDGQFNGAVLVFARDNNGTPSDHEDDTWFSEDLLTPADPAPSANFGNDVAVAGDWIVAGRYSDSTMDAFAGSVYVFRRSNLTGSHPWIQHQKLYASDSSRNLGFGGSVAIERNSIVVGATGCAALAQTCTARGRVYIFVRNDSGTPDDLSDDAWNERQVLSAPDGVGADYFGNDLALNGDRMSMSRK